MHASATSKEVSRQELDGLTAVGSVLLNLDAALTGELWKIRRTRTWMDRVNPKWTSERAP